MTGEARAGRQPCCWTASPYATLSEGLVKEGRGVKREECHRPCSERCCQMPGQGLT